MDDSLADCMDSVGQENVDSSIFLDPFADKENCVPSDNNNNSENENSPKNVVKTPTFPLSPKTGILPRKYPSSNAAATATSPKVTPSRPPEEIKTFFMEKQKEFERNFKDIETYVVDKTKRHKSLTRCDNPRLVELSKPKTDVKNVQNGSIDYSDLKITSRIPKKIPNLQLTGSRNLFPTNQTQSNPLTNMFSSFAKLASTNIKVNPLKTTKTNKVQDSAPVTVPQFQQSTSAVSSRAPDAGDAPPKQNRAYQLRRNTSLTRIRSKPKENAYGYVDTTKMTNSEFEEYKKMKKQGKN